MSTNLLYVPTNRRCSDRLDELVREAQVISRSERSCTVALIEHQEAHWTPEHRQILNRARQTHAVDVLHVTHPAASLFLAGVIGRLGLDTPSAERLMAMLNPQELAYGAGPNKAALIAIALGSSTVHRRDSDVWVDDWPSGPAYPCVPEIEALGRPVTELVRDAHAGAGDGVVQFVGTSAFGSPPQDRRDLWSAGEQFIVELERLGSPHRSAEYLLEDMRQYLIVDPETRYTDDFLEVDRIGRTVMSACAMTDIFRQLPEMPIHRALGSDYMQRMLLQDLGRPLVFHSRKVRHRYDKAREEHKDSDAVSDYAQRDLRHLMLWPILTHHREALKKSPRMFMNSDGTLDTARYAENLSKSLMEMLPVVSTTPAAFSSIYHTASEHVDDNNAAARLRRVADVVATSAIFVDEVAEGVLDYCFLCRHWPALVASAGMSAAAVDPMRV